MEKLPSILQFDLSITAMLFVPVLYWLFLSQALHSKYQWNTFLAYAGLSNIKWVQFFIVILLIGLISCKETYAPTAITASTNYLVVEGLINIGKDSTIIKLSRTIKLTEQTTVPETGAQVVIEDDQNQNYTLTEQSRGKYASAPLGLNPAHRYRLRITTARGKVYLSDFVEGRITPTIDSIGFTPQGNKGLQIYVNAHDASNNTRYYRWEYAETWRFHSKYGSAFYSTGTAIVARTPEQDVYYCFANHVSSNIVLGSTEKLTQDVVYQSPIVFIPVSSEKLELRYSILVKQYALTKDAFNYYQQLRKNTEQLGSIFDPQPTELTGNIHAVGDSNEPVIGYVSAGTVVQKRIFIDKTELPPDWASLIVYPYDCRQDTAYFNDPEIHINEVQIDLIPIPPTYIPTYKLTVTGVDLGFLYSTPGCIDCTLRGTKRQPDFWK